MALDPKELEPGEERHEDYLSPLAGGKRIIYLYRHRDGQLFTCVASDLERARARRDVWLELKGSASPLMARVLNQSAHVVL